MTIAYLTGLQDVGRGQLPVIALGAGVALQRLFRYPGRDWTIAPPALRNGRVDPPAGRCEAFGLLYLADSLVTASFEIGIARYAKDPLTGDEQFEVSEDASDPLTGKLPLPVRAVTHTRRQALGFVDLQHPMLKDKFGIDLKRPAARIADWRQLSLAVHEVLSALMEPTVVPLFGVSFETQQAGGNGRNFAIYESRRELALVRGMMAPLDRAALAALLTAPPA